MLDIGILYYKLQKTNKIIQNFKNLSPVGCKLGLSVGVMEGDFVGFTDGVNVGYSEKMKRQM